MDVVIVTILNMVTVLPGFIIINLLFKKMSSWKPKNAEKIEKLKTIGGVVFSVVYLSTLITLTFNINVNLPTSESNQIILASLFSFLNEFTVTQLLKGVFQYSLIAILRKDLLQRDSFWHKRVVSLINPALLKIFHH